jgi:molecular chaperone HscB
MTQAQCPSCARLQEPRLFCLECGVPLAVELDYFAALGLPRRPSIDPQHLENLYHELGRRVHPDRYANRADAVRDASLTATALLTRAFRTLRDPVSRGLYWLELHGEKLATDNQKVPPELAELIFGVQESLAELRAAEGRGDADRGSLRQQMVEQKQAVDASLAKALSELERIFAQWDFDVSENPRSIVQLKAILSRINYLRTLIRDMDRELDVHDLR